MDLSIVVAAYNISDFIDDCILSIVEQDTHIPFELIAVDDGSTDDTGERLTALAERFPERMRVVTQVNGGLSAARNTGFEHSTGEFIWFIDGDDMIAPGAIDSIVATLKQQALDCVHFGFQEVDEAGTELPGRHTPLQLGLISGRQFFREGVKAFHIATTAWTYVYRRSLLVQSGLRFEPNLLHEDMLHTPQLLQEADRFVALEQAPYLYRQRSGSITQAVNPDKARERVDSLIQIFLDLHYLRRETRDNHFREALGWYGYHVYRKAVKEAQGADLKECQQRLRQLNQSTRAWRLFPNHDLVSGLKKAALSVIYGPTSYFQRNLRDEARSARF
ncbi:glycosyltransferase [Marinobacter bohaiensis]|uniref:glycosyltransferase n=1 Tax=Marinobacter bohaiensis TaxID=2201898 RepID=UPI000DABAD2D|nr:glycosyltransferase [Marinobacter bohaiensis]